MELGFVFTFSGILTLCLVAFSGASVQLEANPPDINMIDKKPLNVKCTYQDVNNTDGLGLQSITMARRGPYGNLDTISELSMSDPNAPTQPGAGQQNGIASITGHLDESGSARSYLSVTWNSPTPREAGTYVCSVHAFNKLGVPVTLTHEVTVRDDSLLVIGQKLKSLEDELTQQKTCCQVNNARLVELEVWRQLTSTSLAFFAKNLVFQHSSQHKNSTYFVSNYKVDDFNVADAVCHTLGGHLAEINDADEWTFIQSFLGTTGLTSIFIGGRDDVAEGKWYWVNSKQPLTFTAWNTGEPNNSGDEDCIEVNTSGSTTNYVWNDIHCLSKSRDTFLCEIE